MTQNLKNRLCISITIKDQVLWLNLQSCPNYQKSSHPATNELVKQDIRIEFLLPNSDNTGVSNRPGDFRKQQESLQIADAK